MSAPNLLFITLDARIREMKAYLQSAFTPQMVEGALDDAIARAVAEAPAHITSEVNAAVRDVCKQQVGAAFLGLGWDERVRDAVRVAVLRELGAAMTEAADAAEKRVAARKEPRP